MKRRKFCTASLISGLLAGCSDETTPPMTNTETFDAHRFQSLMEELRLAYEAKGLHVTESLLPGLNSDEIHRKASWFPSSMPTELLALYQWHNGQKDDAWNTQYPFWIRDCSLTSIERAEFEYSSLMKSYGAQPEDHSMLKHCFPFASFNGGWMVLPCKGHNLEPRYPKPVIFVLEDISIYFYSMELMARTCIDWVQSGARDESTIRVPEEAELQIWKKHNPGIFE